MLYKCKYLFKKSKEYLLKFDMLAIGDVLLMNGRTCQ